VVASARSIKLSQDPDVLAVAADLADPAAVGQITGAALGRFGRIDTLVNNAGALPPCSVGLVSGSMIFSCSMIEPGQPCETINGKGRDDDDNAHVRCFPPAGDHPFPRYAVI
jgi:NAD(P)-dependent dehydrogenase (short-subunit alcohol dehydrogenase family)